MMEGLNQVMEKVVEGGSYKRFEVGNERILLTHLFFADESILFGDCSVENVLSLI